MSKARCTVANDELAPCVGLSRGIEQQRGGKGLRFVQLFNMRTAKPSRSFATVHSGDYMKRGVVLNFCPFCGENIGKHMAGEPA